MPAPHEAIARRLAARFAPTIDARLPAATERAIADERGEGTPFRSADPSVVLAFASFVVSLSSLTWTIYKDLRQKETLANDVALLKGMMLERLQREATAPKAIAKPVRVQLLEAAAEEALDQAERAEKR